MPRVVIRRLFRLGQAFNLRQLRCLEPDVKVVIGNVDVPELVRDLEQLKRLVNDEETRWYADAILSALEPEPSGHKKFVAVFTGA